MNRITVLTITTALAWGAIFDAQANADERSLAKQIVAAAGLRTGLCVHLGCGDGKLTAALGAHENLLVQGFESDVSMAQQARRWIESHADYGRVSIMQGSLKQLPYADNLVNLAVLQDAPQVIGRGFQPAKLLRVLAPRGVALLGGWDSHANALEQFQAELKSAGVKEIATVELDGTWLRFTKPRPEEMDDWTHLNHNAGGNRLSRDRLAGPPSQVRWIDGPTWATAAKGPAAAVTSDGRLFYVFDSAPHRKPQESWATLYARDAFNGLLHWQRPVAGFLPLCFVATNNRVFSVVQPKGNLLALDAASGETVFEYQAAAFPRWVIYDRGSLFMSAGSRYAPRLQCLVAESGELRWQRELAIEPTGSLPNFIIDGEQAFYLDTQKGKLGCLAVATGKDRWQRDVGEMLSGAKWTYGLCSHQTGTLIVGEGMRGQQIHAFSDATGRPLWSHGYQLVLSGRSARHKGSTYDEGFFVDDLYWTHVGKSRTTDNGGGFAWEGLDPATGQVKKRFEYADDVEIGDACHRAQATVNYFLGGHSRFVDAQTGAFCPRAGGIHNSCRYGMLPANGLVTTWSQYTTPYVRGVIGLTPATPIKQADFDGSPRLERGPGYEKSVAGRTGKDSPESAWPCFGHDPMRSAKTDARVPVERLELIWEANVGGQLTAPTVANNTVFVAQPDKFRVVALNAENGKSIWSYAAGGSILTPPTIYRGLCLVGAADGWVSCLDAADGALVWRMQAAPHDRLIVARGRVESVWPVTGGVLVADGLAYFAAGRDGSLDGGIAAYAVKPFTGEVVWRKRVEETPVLRLAMCDDQSLSLGGKTGLSLKTGEPASRITAPEGAFAADLIDLTHRIGVNSGENRIQALATVSPAAIVRTPDTIFIAGQAGAEAPAVRWVSQRNSEVVADMPAPRAAENAEHYVWAFSTTTGELVWGQRLDAAPTFDGMAAISGRLVLSTKDGRVLCFGSP